jgi:D-sedoheptulose 7-phosphate isomerase
MSIAEYLEVSERVLADACNHAGTRNAEKAVDAIVEALGNGRPLLSCGNGGSASDAMHITGELVGRFLKERRPPNCICLSTNPALLTAWANDYSYDAVFWSQVEAYGAAGGVIIGISTSGNSTNVVEAFRTARDMRLTTVALTGAGGGKLAAMSDILIDVPSRSNPLIQQVHICLYHYICERVEERLAA